LPPLLQESLLLDFSQSFADRSFPKKATDAVPANLPLSHCTAARLFSKSPIDHTTAGRCLRRGWKKSRSCPWQRAVSSFLLNHTPLGDLSLVTVRPRSKCLDRGSVPQSAAFFAAFHGKSWRWSLL